MDEVINVLEKEPSKYKAKFIYGKYILIGGFMRGITIFKNISYSFKNINLTK